MSYVSRTDWVISHRAWTSSGGQRPIWWLQFAISLRIMQPELFGLKFVIAYALTTWTFVRRRYLDVIWSQVSNLSSSAFGRLLLTLILADEMFGLFIQLSNSGWVSQLNCLSRTFGPHDTSEQFIALKYMLCVSCPGNVKCSVLEIHTYNINVIIKLCGAEYWETDSSSDEQYVSRLLWNSECSLPCSQKTAIDPCPQPDVTILILSFYLRRGLTSGGFPSDLPTSPEIGDIDIKYVVCDFPHQTDAFTLVQFNNYQILRSSKFEILEAIKILVLAFGILTCCLVDRYLHHQGDDCQCCVYLFVSLYVCVLGKVVV